MWCPSCHTVFDWTNLNILKNTNIHNPHYFEYLRRQSPNGEIPRDAGRVCEEQNVLNVRNIIRFIGAKDPIVESIRKIMDLMYVHMEYNDAYIERSRNNSFRNLRVKYLHNEIDEKKFKRSASIILNNNKKIKAKYDLSNMGILATNNIFNGINETNAKEKINQYREFLAYFNETKNKVGESLNTKEQFFLETYVI
jgi:hypothetical protein